MRKEILSKQLKLRLATRADMDILYNWANDPITRENSFNKNPISYETHVKWFEKMMSAKDIIQFILMYDDIPIGQARLSIEDDWALIGYSISEAYRGMGYGKKLCQLLINKVKEEYPHIKKLVAQVKPQNVASAYCFQKCGFYKSFEQYELDVDTIELMDNISTAPEKLGGGTLLNQ